MLRLFRLLGLSICIHSLIFATCAHSAAQSHQMVSGTAFAVSVDGYLLTAYHVVKNMEEISVEDQKSGLNLRALLVATNEDDDLALLWVQGLKSLPVRLSSKNSVDEGHAVFAMGFSGALAPAEVLTMTTGVVSAAQATENRLVFKHTAEVTPGQSGGPVFSQSGEIIGMILARLPRERVLESQDLINNSVALGIKPIDNFLSNYFLKNSLKSTVAADQKQLPIPQLGSSLSEFSGTVFKVSGKVSSGVTSWFGLDLKSPVMEMMSSLSSDMRRKFFGAYVAGYKEFVRADAGVVMLSPSTIEKTPDSIRKGKVIVSMDKPQFTTSGVIYSSSINDVYVNCASGEMAVSRKEFKKDAFGTGETIQAVQHRTGKTLPFKPVTSPITRQFFERHFCSNKENP